MRKQLLTPDRKIVNERHGHKGERLYVIWIGMRVRCYSPKRREYKYYGGKGVKICKSWHYYSNFRKWAHDNGYKEDLTIDRINSDSDYKPSNCRFITQSENTKNRNNQVWLVCKHGHPVKPETTYFWRNKRQCNTCIKIRDKERWQQKKAARND